jgi:uncharacterized protein YndB with AHSA1/START domain
VPNRDIMESLVIRRTVRITEIRTFEAWTDPNQILQWWGPVGVRCTSVEIDLRTGGSYKIGNLLPDGTTVWITVTFIDVQLPNEFTYSWSIDAGKTETSLVHVHFEEHNGATDVIVSHTRIANAELRENHQAGWTGCLDSLRAFLANK